MAKKKVEVTEKAAEKAVEKDEPKVEVKPTPKAWQPAIGELFELTVGKSEPVFASVESYDPLTVVAHAIANGVHVTNPIEIENFDDCTLTPLDQKEAFIALS